ncbi:MAG: hypothetical protein ACTSUT_05500 [Promethearchaeota archaeon]
MDNILNQTFKYAKKTAKEFYFKVWVKNPPRCPAFDGEVVHISNYGWDHLVFLRKRTKFELLGRLFILERAKKLLETAHNFQSHIKRKDMDFWSFEAEVKKTRVKVIVRSIKDGDKHFYSVIRKGSVEKEIEDR